MSDPTDPSTLVCTQGQPDPVSSLRVVLTPELVQQLAPHTPAQMIVERTPCLQRMLDESGVATPLAAAAILARVITETLGFYLIREQPSPASGPHFEAYLGRMGNKTLAEAQATRGTGFLELTGEDNFHAFTAWSQARGLPVDFAANPELVLDLQYLGLESAFYLATHPGLMAAAEGGYIDGVSVWVNGGCDRQHWLDVHGDLLDGLEARRINDAGGFEMGNPKRRHGIWGLIETRNHFKMTRAVLGV
jgi:predicted chitinase